ncbi:MAG: DMT family transporter [Janthinobacterium lividum]
MRLLGILFVVVMGALTTVEAGSTAQLSRSLRSPWWAGLVFGLASALGLLACLVAASVLAGVKLPSAHDAAAAPWWAWIAGFIAAGYAVSMLMFAESLGSALFTGLTVTAALLASVLLDHMGWVGFKEHPASLLRLCGSGLMVAGLILVALF